MSVGVAEKPIVSFSQKSMVVSIKGKVLRSRRYEQKYYTAMIIPAQDVYSRPSVVEVRSRNRFGDVGEEVSISAVLSGFEGKAYRVTDKDTGESRQMVPVNLFLDLVE